MEKVKNFKKIKFDDIDPFVRHVRFAEIEHGFRSVPLKAYDYRIFYIFKGIGTLSIDQKEYPANRGNLFYILPGIEYMIEPEKANNLVVLGINFDFTHSRSELGNPIPPVKAPIFDTSEICEQVLLADMDFFNRPVFFRDFQSYEESLIKMYEEYISKKRYYSKRINSLFLSLLFIIARHSPSPNNIVTSLNGNIDKVLKYIHENFEKPITNIAIGKALNFHPNYINRLMVTHTNTSLHKYLINHRMSKAMTIMQTSSRSISEIALSVGYSNVNYFSKAFKKYSGMSPRNYLSLFR